MPIATIIAPSIVRHRSQQFVRDGRLACALAAFVACAVPQAKAGTADTFKTGTNMVTSGNYNSGNLPGNTTDVSLTTSSTALTISAASLTMESLTQASTSATYIITISGTNGSLTLGNSSTFTNSNDSTANDLIAVTGSKNLTITGNGSTAGLVLASSGNLDVTGSNSLTIDSNISEANSGTTLTMDGGSTKSVTLAGTNTFSGGLVVAGVEVDVSSDSNLGATGGSVTINGSRLEFTASTTIGSTRSILLGANPTGSNTGSNLDINGGTTTVIYNGVLQNLNGTTVGDIVRQGGGTLELGGASTYSGNTFLNNGTTQLTSGNNRLPTTTVVSLGQSASNNLGTLDLNGNNQTIAGLASIAGSNTGSSTNIIESTSGTSTLTINASGSNTYTYSAGTAANSGIISGSISLVMSGTGTQILGGANSYTGTTAINGGTLLVNGTNSGSGSFSINSGTLGGSGTIHGAVSGTTGGTISPGSSGAAKLTLQSGLNLSGGGTYDWHLVNLKDSSTGTAGTDFDQISLTGGNLALGSSSQLTLDFSLLAAGSGPNSSNSFWDSNHSWTVISGTSTTNTGSTNFSQITDPAFTDGTFSTSTDASGDAVLNFTTAVPEPGSAGLALGGLGVCAGMVRRRSRNSRG